jgi:DNA-binding GntR family transcriptional regulator
MTKEEYVARFVREAIVAGRLLPGERIRQQVLADDLGVSPTPVREALRRLVTEGWLVLNPHVGVSVAEADHAGIDEMYHLREMLESDLAAEAARQITPEELAIIREVHTRFKRATRAHDHAAAREANFQFHILVWQAANAPLTVSILNSLWAQMPWGPMSTVKGREHRTVVEHTEVVDALIGHDPERARRALSDHVNSGRRDFFQAYGEARAIH